MLKPCVTLLILALCLFCIAAQQSQTPPSSTTPSTANIPPDAAQMKNPVKSTPESIAQGKKYYGYDCALCHGANGDGKGDVAVSEKMNLGDFRDPATLQNKSDGELFYVIKNGSGQMPPEGDRVKPTELWNMVNYVRSLAKK